MRCMFAILPLLLGCGITAGFSNEALAQQPVDSTNGADEPSIAEVPKPLIYLPFNNLKDVFEKQGASVFLPYLEYLQLWERTDGGIRSLITEPVVKAVITQAAYVARVEGDLVRIQAELTVQVLGKPWAELPLQFGEAAIGSVTGSDDRILLRGTGDGTYALMLPEKGRHTVTLELVARVRTSPDGRSFAFNVPPVAMSTFELIVPQADQTVEIKPQVVSLPVEAGQDETHVKANLGATRTISASWHPSAGQKPEMELLAGVDNVLEISVADELIHTHATFQYEVLRGVMNELRIAVPKGDRVLDVIVPGAKIEGWQIEDAENQQILTIKLLSDVDGKLTVEVRTERAQPDEAFRVAGLDEEGVVHGIHALDAVRESGHVILSYSSDISLSLQEQRGLTRVSAADVPEKLRHTNALYYRYFNPQFTLTVTARPVEPRVIVTQQAQLVFRDDELRLTSQLDYQIERAGVFTLNLQAPADVVVEDVAAEGLKDFQFDAESGVLTIAFTEQRQGGIRVTVTARRELDPDDRDTRQELPLLEPQAVERETGTIFIYAPAAIEVITDENDVAGAYPLPGTNAPPVANARLVSVWSFNRRPVSITARTVRKPTRLTATIGTHVHLEEQLAEVNTVIQFHVEHAGISSFRFAVAEAVADQVRVNVPGGTASRADAVEDGWLVWTVALQQEVLGRQQIQIAYDVSYDAAEEGGEAEDHAGETANGRKLTLHPIRILSPASEGDAERIDVSSLHGEVVVTKNRALTVTASDLEGELEPIDVRELEVLPQQGDLAYRYYKQPVSLVFNTMKLEIQPVVETVIQRGLVEVVLGHEPVASYRCRYWMKSSERQRLRVDVPSDANILGVLVNQTLVTPEKNTTGTVEGWDSFFVNVARPQTSDAPFSLTIQFRTPVAEFDGNGGRLGLKLPQIGGTESPSVVLQHLRTAVWVPDEIVLIGTPDEYVRELPTRMTGLLGANMRAYRQTSDLDQWISVPASGMVEFPTQGHVYRYSTLGSEPAVIVTFWRAEFLTWVLSIAVVLIGLALLRTPWHNRLTVVLLVVFIAALMAARDADWVLHLLAAARLGLLITLAIWLIHAISGVSSTRQHSPYSGGLSSGTGAAAVVIPPPGVFDDLKKQ